MINKINIIKAILVCAIVNAIYTFYSSSTVFMEQVASWGEDAGRIKAFMRVAEVTSGFWPHILKGWAYTFILSLISCLVLLAWAQQKTHNKALKRDSAKNAAPLS